MITQENIVRRVVTPIKMVPVPAVIVERKYPLADDLTDFLKSGKISYTKRYIKGRMVTIAKNSNGEERIVKGDLKHSAWHLKR